MNVSAVISRFLHTTSRVECSLLYLQLKSAAHSGNRQAAYFLRLYTFNVTLETMH